MPGIRRLRRLRGTWLDPFGYTEERKMERRLIIEYENMIGGLLSALNVTNLRIAAELALLPEKMRGYGHVKQKNVEAARKRESVLLAEFQSVSVACGHVERSIPAHADRT